MRGVRGQALPGVGAGVHLRRQGHQRGAGDAGRGGASSSPTATPGCRRPQDPRPARGRRARLPQPRASRSRRCRAASGSGSSWPPRWREGRRLRPRRAHDGPAPRRRRAAARPAGPARRLRQVGDRHRAPPGRHGARRLDHRPRSRRRPRRRPVVFEGTPADLVADARRSRGSTSRRTSAAERRGGWGCVSPADDWQAETAATGGGTAVSAGHSLAALTEDCANVH